MLEAVTGQHHAPAALPRGKTRYPLCRRLCGPQGRSRRDLKISSPPGFDPLTVKPLNSHYTVCLQMNGAVSKVNKKFISHLTRAQHTPLAAATVQVSHVLQAVRFSCFLLGRGVSFQDGAATGKGFLCAPF